MQTCSSSCGVIAVIFVAVVSFCPKEVWQYVLLPQLQCHPVTSLLRIYHHPSTYAQYLRVVLATWLLTETIEIQNVVDKSTFHPKKSLLFSVQENRRYQAVRKHQLSLSLKRRHAECDAADNHQTGLAARGNIVDKPNQLPTIRVIKGDCSTAMNDQRRSKTSVSSTSDQSPVRQSTQGNTDQSTGQCSTVKISKQSTVSPRGCSAVSAPIVKSHNHSDSNKFKIKDNGLSTSITDLDTLEDNKLHSVTSYSDQISINLSTDSPRKQLLVGNDSDSKTDGTGHQLTSKDICLRGNKGLPEEVSYLFPATYNYIVQQYTKNKPESFLGAEAHSFTLKAWTNANDQNTAMKWINDFQKSSKSTYRVTKGRKTLGQRSSHLQNSSSLSPSAKEADKKNSKRD